MTWFLSYVGANFALVLVVVLAVLALAAVAWFARNWKWAVAAIVMAIGGLLYQQHDKSVWDRAQAEQKARELKVLQGRIDTLTDINRADAVRAALNAAKIDALRKQAIQTPANATACLPEAAARRVGDIR